MGQAMHVNCQFCYNGKLAWELPVLGTLRSYQFWQSPVLVTPYHLANREGLDISLSVSVFAKNGNAW